MAIDRLTAAPTGLNLSDASTAPMRFLFLQGIASRFFDRLGRSLESRGHRVGRVNFNGGDKLFWTGAAVDFTGRPDDWPDFLARVLASDAVTDVLLFGDCRPLHVAAIAVCNRKGVRVHVFEEGYVRPDWVTMELGGVNGHSSLSRDPAWYEGTAKTLPTVPAFPGYSSRPVRRRAVDCIAGAAAELAMTWRFPHYRTHRPWNPAVEGMGWALRLATMPLAKRRSRAAMRRLERAGRVFFLPLQLDGDSQLVHHSHFPSMSRAVEFILDSFAAHAPPDAVLAVKCHPLHNGLTDWRRLVDEIAGRTGSASRVVLVEEGDLGAMLGAASGVVTVNSTVGTLALARGVPTLVLGRAVYDIRGLTSPGGLDAFWNDPVPPDRDIFDAFLKVLSGTCLVRGGYFGEDQIITVVDGVVERLEAAADTVAVPRAALADLGHSTSLSGVGMPLSHAACAS